MGRADGSDVRCAGDRGAADGQLARGQRQGRAVAGVGRLRGCGRRGAGDAQECSGSGGGRPVAAVLPAQHANRHGLGCCRHHADRGARDISEVCQKDRQTGVLSQHEVLVRPSALDVWHP